MRPELWLLVGALVALPRYRMSCHPPHQRGGVARGPACRDRSARYRPADIQTYARSLRFRSVQQPDPYRKPRWPPRRRPSPTAPREARGRPPTLPARYTISRDVTVLNAARMRRVSGSSAAKPASRRSANRHCDNGPASIGGQQARRSISERVAVRRPRRGRSAPGRTTAPAATPPAPRARSSPWPRRRSCRRRPPRRRSSVPPIRRCRHHAPWSSLDEARAAATADAVQHTIIRKHGRPNASLPRCRRPVR